MVAKNTLLFWFIDCVIAISIIIFTIMKLNFKQNRIRSLRGIKNNPNSSYFNSVMQTLASLDLFYFYLKDSKQENDSLTKNLYEFLSELRKNNLPIDNQKYLIKIMSYLVKTKFFKLDEQNRSDEFFSCILYRLFDEELEYKKVQVNSLEKMPFDLFNRVRLESDIFKLFGLAQYKNDFSITFSVFSPGFPTICETIIRFYLGRDYKFVPDWSESLFIEWPQYYFIGYTSNHLNVKELKLEDNQNVLVEEKNYRLVSVGLCLNNFERKGHYISLNKRKDVFYLFDDENICKVSLDKPININAKVIYSVHELINK
ncbi:ubiquitin carboxyl-terminal hydrolase 30 like protein [Tubulinosema ratisbonensis]|uniref:Ubiquitin carboxyl-terminal hydrolase 30 like protein n=1 Tax=Tubulinosema ratisbonensis TaxID=291195 RepID=A0A437AJY1_9MICR|nr:ubiquitin carboxyl-terminal hydrolase 30 like protein [Tubulinosema ratisbonensis]